MIQEYLLSSNKKPCRGQWRFRLFAVLIAGISLSVCTDTGYGDYWSRDINDGTQLYNRPFQPFLLLVVSSIDNHLQGYAVFMNAHESPISLEGTETPDGRFWLNATAQVANDIHSEWKTIGRSAHSGKRVLLRVGAKTVKESLMVNLDIFGPLIRRTKYGRLILKNGEAATFELENLRSPKKQNDANATSPRMRHSGLMSSPAWPRPTGATRSTG